jgi:hypothetical protein
VNLPIAGTDALYDAIAGKVLANLPDGHRVIVEVGNEDWNWGVGPQNVYASWMSGLLGIGGTSDGFVARRSLEAAARFRRVFGARSSDVVALLAGQFGAIGNAALIPRAIDQYESTGQAFDAVCVALYLPNAYQGQLQGWTVAQCLDVHRHYLMLSHASAKAYLADSVGAFDQAVTAYEKAVGRKVLRYAYEGGLTSNAPPGVSPWDLASHPDRADTLRCLFATAQANGFDLFMYYNQLRPPNGGETDGLWQWQGQFAGAGDGSDGRPVNTLAGQLTPANVSPAGQAWREWQRDRSFGLIGGFGVITNPGPIPLGPTVPAAAGLRKAG